MVMNMDNIKNFYNDKMFETAIKAVIDYYNNTPELNGEFSFIAKDDVCVVWFCKTLQNYKVILATPFLDNILYEFSYNGDKQEAYLDVYDKMDNKVISLKE